MAKKESGLTGSLVKMIGSLVGDAIKSSIKDTVKDLERKFLKMALGGVLIILGAVMLIIGVVNFVAIYVPLWQAFLGFGVILAVIGAVLLK